MIVRFELKENFSVWNNEVKLIMPSFMSSYWSFSVSYNFIEGFSEDKAIMPNWLNFQETHSDIDNLS